MFNINIITYAVRETEGTDSVTPHTLFLGFNKVLAVALIYLALDKIIRAIAKKY